MRGPSLSPKEPRHRVAASAAEETSRRGFQRNKVFRDVEKALHVPIRYRNWNCKISTLKVLLVIILVGSLITLLRSPAVYISDRPSNLVSRPGFVDRWIRDSGAADPRYLSMLDVNWDQILNVIEKLTDRDGYQGIGLLNFNNTETNQWKQLLPDAEHVVLQLDYVADNVTWESLFPEWIDEEEVFEVPNCPSLPSLQFPGKPRIDLIAVKLPCNKAGKWSRDVTRLHFQLAAARLAASAKGLHPVHVLFVTDCFPLPNLFACKDLVAREGSAWLYTPNLHRLREKIRLPVGSCELSVPLQAKGSFYSERAHREAYATILHSAHVYVCGAITAAQSIRMSGSTRDLVILVDDSISDYHRGGLEAAGWKIYTIQRIRNPKAEPEAYNEWNYSKFRLWQLTDYDKIIFIDADLLILRNIDFLFEMPEISAIGNNATLFNSGVMVVEPSNCTFQLLMDHINEIESYNGGDQGYLNEIFTWWHRIPKHMNFLKHFWEGDEVEKKQMKTRLFGADPPILYVIHYLGNKPWLCFRDYDCNWNVDILQEFASDVAHKTWWKVHDAMPENLQKYCLLRSKQKAQLEWDRRQAEKGNYTDGHWKIKIKDKRLKTCFEEFCFWESMLWHWGEKNWTDNSTASPSPPAIKKFVTMQLTHCLPTKNLSWTPRVHHRRHSPPTSAVRFAPIFPAVTVSPPKHQKTHSMPPEKQEVFKSMENWATENVLPLLKPVKDCWQPQSFLPDPALPLEEFNDQVKELRERMAELPDDYFVVLVGDMITEEALPTYQTMINTLDGVKDETGASSSPWAVWTRAWTAEENRHGDLLRNYLYLSGRVNMFMIERTLQYLVGAGMDPGTENNPYLGFVYTSFQERATFVSHGNTARLAKEGGDPVLARICGTIAADEKRHEMAYSKIVGKLLEIDPTGAMLAIGDMMKKKITMPAHLMFDGEDPRLFEHFAAVAQRIGVYTSDDYADIVEALNERWGLEKLEGLRDEGRRAQEFVCNLAPRIRKLQERAEESAKKMGPQAVKFSWIFNREITL